jgi:hypothetical protein
MESRLRGTESSLRGMESSLRGTESRRGERSLGGGNRVQVLRDGVENGVRVAESVTGCGEREKLRGIESDGKEQSLVGRNRS